MGKSINESVYFFNDTVRKEIERFSKKNSFEYYKKAAELMSRAISDNKRIHITGIGKPHHVANYAASLFSSIGTPTYFLDGTEATHGSSGQVLPGDVVICISYYGDVEELNKTVALLKKNKAKIISVTGFNNSYIATAADVHLNVFVEKEGDDLNKPPRTSMLITLFSLMTLSIILQYENKVTIDKYVMWHPSGKLGEKQEK